MLQYSLHSAFTPKNERLDAVTRIFKCYSFIHVWERGCIRISPGHNQLSNAQKIVTIYFKQECASSTKITAQPFDLIRCLCSENLINSVEICILCPFSMTWCSISIKMLYSITSVGFESEQCWLAKAPPWLFPPMIPNYKFRPANSLIPNSINALQDNDFRNITRLWKRLQLPVP